MLRMIQTKSAEQAKSYYVSGLSTEDYYVKGQELDGTWHGKGAKLLSLDGKVGADAFYDLCENRDPANRERLTPRTKERRTIGYDINFHCPKSVSALYAHAKDERIVAALREAVGETMREMETAMQTRVRVGDAQEQRLTGNMVWAEFVHMTARPVDGNPDPHLHAHCFAFNATYDEVEARWKAGFFRDMKRDAPYYEAAFHSRLAGHMRDLGYGVEAKGKFWEIEGVPQSVIDKYSRRRDQIETLTEELGITDAAEKDRLGATSREKKVETSMTELSTEWASRLTVEEKAALDAVLHGARSGETKGQTRDFRDQAINYALDHVFERASVVSERDVLESALRYGVGRVSVADAKTALATDQRVIFKTVEGEALCTTRDIHAEEKALVAFAKERRGVFDPIASKPHEFTDKRLNDGQRRAVAHVLSSRDQVTMFRGRPGTGKTALMTEAVAAIYDAGYHVFPLAPTAEASRGTLRAEGFKKANTVESFLQSEAKQKEARGQVIWVDEAGLLSARSMRQLFDVAKTQGARVVLAGDTGQHNAVARGDAMRLLEKHAGLKIPVVTEIMRQKETTYREAVEAMSAGETSKAFETLEKMNAFVEDKDVPSLHGRIVEDYVGFLKSGKEALIIAPQHQEGIAINAKVREALRAGGRLNGPDETVARLTNLKLTEAERSDPRHYEQGTAVQFVQNAQGFARGERLTVVSRNGDEVSARNCAGETKILPLAHSARFQVYRSDKIALAAGDRVRITNNSFAKTGQRLDNGTLHTVGRVHANGEIELKNKAVLAADFGHLTHGYYVTSYVSQSKTVDWTLLAQSSLSFKAGSREQMNVSLSRGREGLRIYTDDKPALRACADRSAPRRHKLE